MEQILLATGLSKETITANKALQKDEIDGLPTRWWHWVI